MPKINSFNVINLMLKDLPHEFVKQTTITQEEIQLKNQLMGMNYINNYYVIKNLYFIDILLTSSQTGNYYVDVKQNLIYDEHEIEDEDEIDLSEFFEEYESTDETASQSTDYSLSPPTKTRKYISFSKKQQVVNFLYSTTMKKRKSFSSIKTRFRFIDTPQQLSMIEKQVREGGSRNDKIEQIITYVHEEFKKAKRKRLIVHDIDLKRWALRKANEINFCEFTASNKWIWKFKKTYKIVSRKITKFVTLKSFNEQYNIEKNANEFIQNCKPYFDKLPLNQILNSDQSGFNLEIHSGRTLEYKGTKKVECQVQSQSSMTHSYTIQPTISADGELLSPLYMVLQEKDGKFGVGIQAKMKIPNNICVSASKSGKLTKGHLVEWFSKVYFPNVQSETTLLIDSWTTYNDENAINRCKPDDKTLSILRIPPKTTALIQPCDVFFFRMWKSFVRKISDRILLDDLKVNLHDRNEIMKIQSLTHNQFRSPRFKQFIKFAWFKAGYVHSRPPHFKTPVEFCFDLSIDDCHFDCTQCYDGVFVICSWCKLPLCFNHFYQQNHYCNNYIQ